MIINSYINIPVTDDLSSEYIEDYFIKNNLNVLRWAIVDNDGNNYCVNISVIE